VARRVSALTVLLAALGLAPAAPVSAAVGPGAHEDAIVVVTGDVVVPRGHTADEVVVIDGDVRVAGTVDGNVTVLSGDAAVSGTIDGNLFTASGVARLLPSAEVTGDVLYGDERPEVSLSARVLGDVEEETLPDLGGAVAWVGAFVVWLAIGVSAAVLGALLLLVAPGAAEAIEARSRERVGPLIAIGITALIVLPVAAGIAAFTLVGLPLAIVILLALLPIGVVAYLTSAWVLGRRVVKAPRNRYLAFLAGLGILRALALIPVLGLVFGIGAAVFGLGLIGAAIGAARSQEEPGPAQSPGS
jgi:hypothetical protein